MLLCIKPNNNKMDGIPCQSRSESNMLIIKRESVIRGMIELRLGMQHHSNITSQPIHLGKDEGISESLPRGIRSKTLPSYRIVQDVPTACTRQWVIHVSQYSMTTIHVSC